MSDQVPQERDTRFDFSGSNIIGGFLKSINADITPAQTLTLAPDETSLQIADLGAGVHQFRLGIFIPATGSPGPPPVPTTVPAGVLTTLGNLVIFVTGWYAPFCFVHSDAATPLPGTTISKLQLDVNGVGYEDVNFQDAPSANITDYAKSVAFNPVAFTAGDMLTLSILQDSIGPFDVFWQLSALHVGGI